MDRTQLLELWNDMWQDGNWVPSWPDSLAELTAEQAAWTPDPSCNSVWQEVVHTIFWRQVTLNQWAGLPMPTSDDIERLEFAAPSAVTEEAWAETVRDLERTQDEIASAIQDVSKDLGRVTYHLIHDPYHLGRITQLRKMQGSSPKF